MEVTIASGNKDRNVDSITAFRVIAAMLGIQQTTSKIETCNAAMPQAIQHHIYILINYAQFLVKVIWHQIIRTQQPNTCTFSEEKFLKSAPWCCLFDPPETLVFECHLLHRVGPTYSVFARTFPKENHFCLEMNQQDRSSCNHRLYSWATKKNPYYFPLYWLVNRDPYFMVYYNPYIPG